MLKVILLNASVTRHDNSWTETCEMRFVQIQELQYTKNPKGTTIPQEFQKKTDWSTGKKKKLKLK